MAINFDEAGRNFFDEKSSFLDKVNDVINYCSSSGNYDNFMPALVELFKIVAKNKNISSTMIESLQGFVPGSVEVTEGLLTLADIERGNQIINSISEYREKELGATQRYSVFKM